MSREKKDSFDKVKEWLSVAETAERAATGKGLTRQGRKVEGDLDGLLC